MKIKLVKPIKFTLLPRVNHAHKTHISNLEKLHDRAGRIVYGLSWDTNTADILTQTRWDSLERMYKVRLAKLTFKCIKGYNATELKHLFVQRNSSRESRRNGEIVLPSPDTNFMRNSIKYRGVEKLGTAYPAKTQRQIAYINLSICYRHFTLEK